MPGQFIGVPHSPQKPEKKCACREHVSQAAEQHLSWRGRLARKTHHLQTAHHHARSGTPENRKKREILQINNGKRRDANYNAQLAQREVPAERAEEAQKSPVGKQQAKKVDQSRQSPILNRRDRI